MSQDAVLEVMTDKWLTSKQIADKSGISRQCVTRALRRLIKFKEVIKKPANGYTPPKYKRNTINHSQTGDGTQHL